jgi:hypothetical protein
MLTKGTPLTGKHRRILLAAVALVLAIPVSVGVAGGAAYAATAQDIANTATAQKGNGCSPYPGACSTDWCAIFAKWVWSQNGITSSTLTPQAISFYTYGVNNNTWSQTPHVGDAAVFGDANWPNSAPHVAIVTEVNGNSITTVAGNDGNNDFTKSIVKIVPYSNWHNTSPDPVIKGFTTPVGLGGGGGTGSRHTLGAGDFNGDGKVDIAGIDANNDMRLYTGNGDGTLSGGTLMWASGGHWAGFHGAVAGDFNGDGKVDIAGIDANNDMRLYTGNGDGTLSGGSLMMASGGLWTGFHGIVAGDFNGDGKVDIAGIDANNNMSFYAGNGDGTLGSGSGSLMMASGGLWTGFKEIAAGDFNGDGKVDIAGIDANNDMRLYTGNGAGTLSGGSLMWASGGLWAGF